MPVRIIISLLLFVFLCSCRPSPQFQQQYTIPSYKWDYSYKPTFTFDITDTTSAYQLIFVIRHTEAYPFSNIWLMMNTIVPGDTVGRMSRIEVPLSEASGQWRGRGMGEIWEQRVPLSTPSQPTVFPRKGRYIIRLGQDMRRNPLPEILQVGLRLEKIGPIASRK